MPRDKYHPLYGDPIDESDEGMIYYDFIKGPVDYYGDPIDIPPPPTTNLNVILPDLNPHYTDRRFQGSKSLTIFGRKSKDLHYEYSDRLEQWDFSKAEAARKEADKKAKPRTAKWFQEYLAAYHDQPVSIRHIVVGVNCATGYAWHCYGFVFKKDEK